MKTLVAMYIIGLVCSFASIVQAITSGDVLWLVAVALFALTVGISFASILYTPRSPRWDDR